MKTGAAYTAVGGEMSAGTGEAIELASTDVNAQLDGAPVVLRAYNIRGHNYFRLRDLGRLLNFGVTWDAAAKSVAITPNADYTEDDTVFYMKSFGAYGMAADWAESTELSRNDKYFYLKNDRSSDANVSAVSVESGRHRYAEADHSAFRETTYRRLLKQVANDPEAGSLFGKDDVTAKGYALYTFTIEYEGVDLTERMHYIVGDYKYVLITETDRHNESAAGISAVSRAMADSFEWAR
jgi:hypothetical protein